MITAIFGKAHIKVYNHIILGETMVGKIEHSVGQHTT